MFIKLAVVFVLVQSVFGQISFNDGKIGVNFGGYHAEAGLGGLLSGNTADGALSASAGTPFGQQAGAGLGGGLRGAGRSGGGGFAGASAGGGVGASAAFGGTLDAQSGGGGGLTAESHIPGRQRKVSQLGQIPNTGVQSTDNGQQLITPRGQFANDNAQANLNANNNYDYRNFLDFGFFQNTAAGFGGPVIPA